MQTIGPPSPRLVQPGALADPVRPWAAQTPQTRLQAMPHIRVQHAPAPEKGYTPPSAERVATVLAIHVDQHICS